MCKHTEGATLKLDVFQGMWYIDHEGNLVFSNGDGDLYHLEINFCPICGEKIVRD